MTKTERAAARVIELLRATPEGRLVRYKGGNYAAPGLEIEDVSRNTAGDIIIEWPKGRFVTDEMVKAAVLENLVLVTREMDCGPSVGKALYGRKNPQLLWAPYTWLEITLK